MTLYFVKCRGGEAALVYYYMYIYIIAWVDKHGRVLVSSPWCVLFCVREGIELSLYYEFSLEPRQVHRCPSHSHLM